MSQARTANYLQFGTAQLRTIRCTWLYLVNHSSHLFRYGYGVHVWIIFIIVLTHNHNEITWFTDRLLGGIENSGCRGLYGSYCFAPRSSEAKATVQIGCLYCIRFSAINKSMHRSLAIREIWPDGWGSTALRASISERCEGCTNAVQYRITLAHPKVATL